MFDINIFNINFISSKVVELKCVYINVVELINKLMIVFGYFK